MEYVVYILFSESLKRFYVGHTYDIVGRLAVHNRGGKKYTTKGIPWRLIKTIPCSSRSEAVRLELRIKKRGIKRYLDDN